MDAEIEQLLTQSTRNFNEETEILEDILNSGYSLIDLSKISEEFGILERWEDIFRASFLNTTEINKSDILKYHSVGGLATGYRKDGINEFYETRLVDYSSCTPDVPAIDFKSTVLSLSKVLAIVGIKVMKIISEDYLGIDQNLLKSLTDLDMVSSSQMVENSNINTSIKSPPLSDAVSVLNSNGNESSSNVLSSSVLRICSYPPIDNIKDASSLAFGPHTDTTFLTISPVSSVSGLEIYDWKRKVFLNHPKPSKINFMILKIFSKT